jgi:hypothetical protein
MSDDPKPTTAEQFAAFFTDAMPARGLAELFGADQPETDNTDTDTEED